MNSGTKVFLTIAGVAGGIGAIFLFSSKSAKAAELPKAPAVPEPDVVVVPPAETPTAPPVVVPAPPAEVTIDTAEASRLMLRWWAAEGESLLFSEEDRSALRSHGFPVDFGTAPDDLGPSWGPRKVDVAAAFERLSGLSPDDGAPTPKLFDALVRWAKSQELPSAPAPSSPTEPVPQVIEAPNSEATVVVPEPAAAPLPAPPLAGPPPFVPPLPIASQALQAPALPLALPVALPVSLAAEPPAPAFLPVSVPAAAVPVNAPTLVSAETAALVAELLDAEHRANWKRTYATVGAWQKSRGLKVDQKYGPKTALAVATEIGTVPIVRYWPAGAMQGKAVADYQAALLELARAAPEPRAAQLRISAQREKGQGFGSNQTALPDFERVQITQVA